MTTRFARSAAHVRGSRELASHVDPFAPTDRRRTMRSSNRAPPRRTRAMRFIQEFGYTVKVGQEEAHQKWLMENEATLATSMPPGSKYLGTFATVYSSEKRSGWYKTYFEL